MTEELKPNGAVTALGIVSLVLGIMGILVAFIPCCSALAWFPAPIGILLAIIALVLGKKGGGTGMAIAGLILSVLALGINLAWGLLFHAAAHAR